MPESKTTIQLVVIGSSAGGIEALSKLVATLNPEFPAAIVIAQHLDPTRHSHLGEILARVSPLRVVTVQNHSPLERGTVYVIPANNHVEITDHDMTVLTDGPGRPKPSVDMLLTSAASIFKEQLVAVILTGTGQDGARGALAVKRAGGTVIVQNPSTAAFPGMPRAIAPESVDNIVDLPQIGPLLYALLTGTKHTSTSTGNHEVEEFLAQLHLRSGIDFSAYKPGTILRRLERRIVATATNDIAGYSQFLATHPEEYQKLVSTFLIKVTEFMRDAEFFTLLREEILPELIAYSRTHDHKLRIWSAGCATGEEPYSLAILLSEVLGPERGDFSIKIFATDLDTDAILFARSGIYPAAAIAELSHDLVERYFNPGTNGYEIKKQVRSMVVFGEHDLAQRAPFPCIDLVLCRNVLIYFAKELQNRALQLFTFALHEGGYLALGKSETVRPNDEFFTLQYKQHKLYRRLGQRVMVAPVPTPEKMLQTERISRTQHRMSAQQLTQTQHALDHLLAAQAHLLLNLPIGVVVVDQRYDIQEINLAGRRLLGIHAQAINEDFVHLAQHVPPRLLRTAIDRTIRENSYSQIEGIEVPHAVTGEPIFVRFDFYPQQLTGTDGPTHVLILVTDISTAYNDKSTRQQEEERRRSGAEAAEQRAHELQQANRDLKDRMEELSQRTVELEQERQAAHDAADRHAIQLAEIVEKHTRQMGFLADSNRLLLEANEQLNRRIRELHLESDAALLTAEEAQAAIEEVETLNEELQATNEEFETLNEELQATIEELNTSNADLVARGDELHEMTKSLEQQHQNSEHEREQLAAILANMVDAVVVIAPDGNPVLTNAAYLEMLGRADIVIADESGRPLPPEQHPRQRAANAESFSTTFTFIAPDGSRRWGEAIGQPLHPMEEHQLGVLVIRDITERNLRRLQEEFLALANHELRSPLATLWGFLDLLIKDLIAHPTSERALRYARSIFTECERLLRHVDDLMDVSRLQSGKFTLRLQPVIIDQLIRDTVKMAQVVRAQPPVRLTVDAEEVVVNGDAQRLQQVIFNLLTNASIHAATSPQIDVRLHREDHHASIEVQDYGIGIPHEHLPDLFSRFYQVSHNRLAVKPGLGLGLYIVHQIVTGHGGSIEVVSTQGVGTTFTIRLPIAEVTQARTSGENATNAPDPIA
ncbi:MAG: hypothetical protein NVS2B7_25280 [Herpetosiphon sp.]